MVYGRLADTFRLPVWMVYMDVHWSMQGADQHGLVGSQGFMSPVDGLCFPVCPVDVLLEQSHGKDVWNILSQDYTGADGRCRLVKTSGQVGLHV